MLEAGQDPGVRARDGRAAAGPVDREDRGALRAYLLVPLGPGRALAARRGGRGPPAAPARGRRASARAVPGRRGLLDAGPPGASLSASDPRRSSSPSARSLARVRWRSGSRSTAGPGASWCTPDGDRSRGISAISTSTPTCTRPGSGRRSGGGSRAEPGGSSANRPIRSSGRLPGRQGVERFVSSPTRQSRRLARELNACCTRRRSACPPASRRHVHPGDPEVLDVAREALDRYGFKASSSTSTCSASPRRPADPAGLRAPAGPRRGAPDPRGERPWPNEYDGFPRFER